MIAESEAMVCQAKQHETLLADEVLEIELTIIDSQKLLAEKRLNLAHALVDLNFAIGIENQEQLLP
ncbi:hypothetical protein JXJ21_11910 [candidate division KSB1 bacterium]|nr:hypothetical protein [candidate division KSB1 bacterium]